MKRAILPTCVASIVLAACGAATGSSSASLAHGTTVAGTQSIPVAVPVNASSAVGDIDVNRVNPPAAHPGAHAVSSAITAAPRPPAVQSGAPTMADGNRCGTGVHGPVNRGPLPKPQLPGCMP